MMINGCNTTSDWVFLLFKCGGESLKCFRLCYFLRQVLLNIICVEDNNLITLSKHGLNGYQLIYFSNCKMSMAYLFTDNNEANII